MRLYPTLLTLLMALFAFTACQQEKDKPTEELEEFVLQVEESVEDGEIKQWSEFETEFHQRLESIEESTEDMSDEVEQQVKDLEARYEEAKANWESGQG